jgi:hypothetical protein
MRVTLNAQDFEKQLSNIVQYSFGFLEGAQRAKPVLLENMGRGIIDALGTYIDVAARQNPDALHHVYEWYQEGIKESRLYDLDYSVTKEGLSFGGTFRQSKTMSQDATKPFYDKARIMEEGVPVTITPKKSSVLAFNVNGETVFTRKSVTNFAPGGEDVQGSFERVIDEFISRYLTQSFLRASGLYNYIENPILYKQDFAKGAKLGRSQGLKSGYTWISRARIELDA